MKYGKTAAVLQDQLNRALPVFGDIKFGDLFFALIQSFTTAVLTKAGLVIKTASSPVVKAANPILACINGVYIRKAASDMAALSGTLATAKSAAWAFYIDTNGTLSVSAKTADASTHDAALASLPLPPLDLAQIGIVVVDNATGANFVGGTTALDTASLTVTYYDTTGAIPNALLGAGNLGQ